MEELAKARWLYEAAEYQWSRPLGLYGLEPQPAGDIVVPEQLRNRRLPHLTKLQTVEQYASGLGGFNVVAASAKRLPPPHGSAAS
ncbi:hypothetical protein OG470_21060 [Micromonospora sp. NBC_00389]|uniref:hypothetical protein n=1 Tax=Micromonospora sp. NBC_00389 TaxID=2903586 RepID=UPI002E20A0B0